MPPLASSESSSTESFEVLGFEIEAEETRPRRGRGSFVVTNIVPLPKPQDDDDTDSDEELFQRIPRNGSLDDPDALPTIVEENEETGGFFYSALENAINTVTCGYAGDDDFDCSCKPLKSAMRDPSKLPTPVDRNVSFTKLKIREYFMTLGDHPSASSGPPVQLDWNVARESIQDLDDYERAREPRRNRKQLRLSYKERERLLFNERGFTVDQVNAAWLEALTIRRQRQETLKQSDYQIMLEEAWQSTQRKVTRLFSV